GLIERHEFGQCGRGLRLRLKFGGDSPESLQENANSIEGLDFLKLVSPLHPLPINLPHCHLDPLTGGRVIQMIDREWVPDRSLIVIVAEVEMVTLIQINGAVPEFVQGNVADHARHVSPST